MTDVQTNQSIFTKIYPQNIQNIPVVNPKGKYMIKLYCHGQQYQITIDDKLPVNSQNEVKFAQTTCKSELWPLLLSKAIYKLVSVHFDKSYNIQGTGLVIHALTGVWTQNIKDIQNEYKFIKEVLADKNYIQEKMFVSCFSFENFQPQAKSNQEKETKLIYINQMKKINYNEKYEILDSLTQIQQQGGLSSNYQNHEYINQHAKVRRNSLSTKNTNIIPAFNYLVTESFENDKFNMVFVTPRSNQEIKARKDYFELQKMSQTKMTKEEKLETRKKKKELRDTINRLNQATIDLINVKSPQQYKFLKFYSQIQNSSPIIIQTPFRNSEINIAKTCIANKLASPPNYDLPEIRDDGKSMISSVKNEDSFIMKPLDDFSMLGSKLIRPLKRQENGKWILIDDFKTSFENFLIFYNPSKYKHNLIVEIKQNQYYEITPNFDKEILIIQRNEEFEQDELIDVIFGFTSKSLVKQANPQPYTILQTYNFNEFQPIYEQPVIHDEHCQKLSIKNMNSIFKINTFCYGSFNLYCSSMNSFEFTSIHEYLTKYESYEQKILTIEYPSVDKNTYYMFSRVKIQTEDEKAVLIIRLSPNSYTPYLKLKIITKEENESYMLQNFEGVAKNLTEQQFMLGDYLRLEFSKDKQYYLVLEGQLPFGIQEGQFELNLYQKIGTNINIQQIELVEPLEYIYQYQPTKYGILFREKIYVNKETQTSFHVRLVQNQGQAQQPTTGKQPKGVVQQEISEGVVQNPRPIIVELFRNEQKILYNQGYNEILISHVDLYNNKDNESTQYYLQCTFDLLEFPDCKKNSDELKEIYAILKVIGASDTIGIIKDTKKEDSEAAIKKSWEDNEPGRAAKAKISRQKYLLQQKQKTQPLTEEELALINEPRLTYKERQDNTAKDAKGGKKPPVKKEEKKVAKGGKPSEGQEEEVKQIVRPNSNQHNMNEIKTFLSKLEEPIVKEQLPLHAGMVNVRNDLQKQEIKERAYLSAEEVSEIYQRNTENRLQFKLYLEQQEKKLRDHYDLMMAKFKEDFQNYNQKKESIKERLNAIQSKEKELISFVLQEQQCTVEQFAQKLNEYRETVNCEQKLIRICELFKKNLLIKNLEAKIVAAVENFDIEALTVCKKEFEDNQVSGIPEEKIASLNSMLQEAEGNPNYQAEKLAEQKKAGKKKK